MLTSRRAFVSGFSFAMLAGFTPIPANAGALAMKGKKIYTPGTFAPGASWNGTAGSGGTPSVFPITRTTAQPWCVELFPNWDTQVGLTTLGVDAGAHGGIAGVDVYCESTTPVFTVSVETWNFYNDPNGKAWSDYGWHAVFDAAAAYATGVGFGVNRPQANVWFYARPTDATMQGQLIGPFILNPRSSRFDGTVNVGPTQTVNSFAKIAKYKHDNSIERLNAIFVEGGNFLMDSAVAPNTQVAITTTNVVGITLTAAQTAQFTATISGATLNVAVVSSGTVGAGDSLCGPVILPNCVIAAYGTMGTTGVGGVGTYYLQATSPDDQANTPPNYTITPAIAFTTTKTVILGDGTVANWQSEFDGIRIEGAGLKTDIAKIGYGVAAAINSDSSGYNALSWYGCEQYAGTPNNNGGVTRTGTGAHILVGGLTPQQIWMAPNTTNSKSGAASGGVPLVPGGVAESILGWYTFMSCYHHDNFSGHTGARLDKHTIMQRIPQPLATNFRTLHGCQSFNSSSIAAGLRTFVNCFTLQPPSTGTSPTVRTTASQNGQNGSVVLAATGGTTFTYAYTSATTLQVLHDSFATGTGWSPAAPSTEGWSVTTNIDTTGRSVVYLNLSTNPPANAIPVTAVGAGLQLGTIIDVHSDILALFLSAAALPSVTNRAARFIEAYGVVSAGPILLNGSGSYIQDVGIRNFIHQDISVAVGASPISSTIAGVLNHFVMRDCTTDAVDTAMSLSSLTLDAYCEFSGNSLNSIGWSVGAPFSASFDGSNIMTVTAVPNNGGTSPNILYTSGVCIGAILATQGVTILSQQTITADGNGASTPLRFGTYVLSGTVGASAAAARNVSALSGFQILDNVVRTGSVLSQSVSNGNSKTLSGAANTTMYVNPVSPLTDYTPITSGPVLMANGIYAGARTPVGWKNAP